MKYSESRTYRMRVPWRSTTGILFALLFVAGPAWGRPGAGEPGSLSPRASRPAAAVARRHEASASPAHATPSPSSFQKPRTKRASWWVDGDLRVLTQGWHFFSPRVRRESTYTFAGNRARFRLHYRAHDVAGLAEFQDTQMLGLPTDAIGPLPVGQLGVGATYDAYALRSSVNSAGLRQGFLKIGDPKSAQVQVGRFDYSSEGEVSTGDKTLDALKNQRLKERLIGPFGYSDFGRSFDGLRLDVDSSTDHFTGFVAHPTQGGFEPHFGTELSQILTSEVSWTFKRSPRLPDSEGEVFWVHYDDSRPVQIVDNRPVKLRGTVYGQGGIGIDTYGFHFITKLGRNGDGLVWFAHQSGKWGNLTQDANAYDVELGYHFSHEAPEPWLRVGYSAYSGDGNPSDGTHGTFFAPLPTARQFCRFPFYTMANLDDVFASLQLKPTPKTAVRLEVHGLSLDSPNDLWYSGAGATQASGTFGYTGRPSGGHRGLATVYDIEVDQHLDRDSSLGLYYGVASGGPVVKTNFGGSSASAWMLEYDLKIR